MMLDYFRSLWFAAVDGWGRFWFNASTAHTLAVIRVFTGLMLAYMHLVWCLRLGDFFGPNAMIDSATHQLIHQYDYTWSYLRFTDSMTMLWMHELLAVVMSLAMAVGFLGRITTASAWFLTLMVCHRATGHLFGLDQTVMMLAFGLALAPSSAVLSFDALIRSRLTNSEGAEQATSSSLQWLLPSKEPSSIVTFATRLIQLQLCVIYLFGGLSKMRGSMWWDGSAIWFAAASYEYQSLDFTWIGRWPMLGGVITHVTIFWEMFYCVAVWPMRSRPIVLAIAFCVHLSIAIFLGMITFGSMMIVANMVFVTPEFMRRICPFFQRSTSPLPSDTELRNVPSPL